MRDKQKIMEDAKTFAGYFHDPHRIPIAEIRQLQMNTLILEVLCDIRKALWFLANTNEEDI